MKEWFTLTFGDALGRGSRFATLTGLVEIMLELSFSLGAGGLSLWRAELISVYNIGLSFGLPSN